MKWEERVKEILSIPKDARIITRPYYRQIKKKNGKSYRALTLQYTYKGRRRYKHINKEKEALVRAVFDSEDTIIEHIHTKLRELKTFIESIHDSGVKSNLTPISREIDRLIMKLSTRIF